MKKYEIRQGAGKFPYFEFANSPEEAIEKVVSSINKNSRNNTWPENFTAVETNKLSLSEVTTPFTECFDNGVDVSLDYLESYIDNIKQFGDFIEQPEFQRAHVWTEEQQVKYVEFFLRGGKSGRIIYTNRRDDWDEKNNRSYPTVLVDGLQRLTALRKFVRGELKIFGGYTVNDFERIPSQYTLRIVRNNLKTEKEVLTWYCELNTGGTQHTDAEIKKVKDMIQKIENGE